MNEYISIRDQTCPNKRCAFYGRRLENNVIAHSRQYPRFKCKACGKTWVIHRSNVYYRVKKDPQKIAAVQGLLEQGYSIRKVAQTVGVSPGTVQRWKTKFK